EDERELRAVRAPRRRAAARRAAHEALTAGEVGRVRARYAVRRVGRRERAVGRDEGDLAIVGRPGGHRAVARAAAAEVAGRERQLPDRGQAAVAIGGEGDARSVVRPGWLAIVELALGERPGVAAAARHDVDVPEPVD